MRVAVIVAVGTGVNVEVEIAVSVGTTLAAGAHEAKIKATSKTVTMFLIFIDYLVMQGTAQRCALLGGWVGVDNVRDEKKAEARKMLINRQTPHPSSARFVGLC
ncbi:MAG: hypothetical protein HKUEN01_35090 [Candidatus Kuenenia stuttgartiensis]|nr:MAG: hypothetical protein HKUEN01_35090 [Candidatus Kuenenia stuttgartiensis]